MDTPIYLWNNQTQSFVESSANVLSARQQADGRWIVTFKSGKEFTYSPNNVRLYNNIKIESTETENIAIYNEKLSLNKNIFQYYIEFCRHQVKIGQSAINDLEEKQLCPFGIIEKQLNELPQLSNSALLDYFGKKVRSNRIKGPIIFPFGCNLSQRDSVEMTLRNSLSVIQGPPGTGKTQTILNIIANLLIRKKTIAVVSNNNSATKNVLDKLSANGFGDIVAPLGNKNNIDLFFQKGIKSIDFPSEWNKTKEETSEIERKITGLDAIVRKIFEKRLELYKAIDELEYVKHQKSVFDFEHSSDTVTINALKEIYCKSFNLKKLNQFKTFVLNRNHYAYLIRVFIFWKFGIFKIKKFIKNVDSIISAINSFIFEKTIIDLETKISEAKEWLKNNNESQADSFSDLSMQYFKAQMATAFKGTENFIFEKEYFKNVNYDEFQKRFPITLSSTYSLQNSMKKSVPFDYVIVDEASQVNLPTALACLGVARNAVIVGDSKQLTHISDNDSLRCSSKIPQGYDAVDFNLLTSVLTTMGKKVPVNMLREHYRCNPLIIGFCNKRFYNGEMVIMSKKQEEFPFEIVDVETGHIDYQNNSPINNRQIEETKNIIELMEKQGVNTDSIGVVSPYKAHAYQLYRSLNIKDLESDTVHKYQGREKDVIIYNSVQNSITKFNDNSNLVNVAISRAKNKLVVVAPLSILSQKDSNLSSLINYITYQDETHSHYRKSKYNSIFDVLYQSPETILQIIQAKNEKESPAETLFRLLLEKLRTKDEFKSWDFRQEYYLYDLVKDIDALEEGEQRLVKNGSRLDFLIFDIMNNTPILAIEIDGSQFHNNSQNDSLKDSIMGKINIPLVRLRTDSIEGNEEKLITETLNNIYETRNKE